MSRTATILVIAGSVRPRRICLQVAPWVALIGVETGFASLEVVDLKDWPLPLDDEPHVPHRGNYLHGHTRAWGRKIAGADGFVFVTPQYNWGYPAALKNAIDHLCREWGGKPALVVTYGGHGGDRCASQLRQVLTAVGVAPIETPGLMLPRAVIEADAGEIDPAEVFADQAMALRSAFETLAAALTAPD